MNEKPEAITAGQLMDALAPLWIALHEKKLIQIQEMALFYEDALARRQIDREESPDSTAFAQSLASALHKLAATIQAQQSGSTTSPEDRQT